jgi:hypothetical protein
MKSLEEPRGQVTPQHDNGQPPLARALQFSPSNLFPKVAIPQPTS